MTTWTPLYRTHAAIERAQDRIDEWYLTGQMTSKQYDAMCAELQANDEWLEIHGEEV